jgi:hypothetical protein
MKNASVSLQTQKQEARNSEYMLQPGQPFPDEGSNPFTSSHQSSASATSTASETSATSAAASSTSETAAHSGHHGLSTGAIAGIAVGSALVGLLVAALFFLWIRNKSLHKKVKQTETAQLPGPGASERGSYFYGAAPPHMSQAYSMGPDKNDRTGHVSQGYSPRLPQYAPPPNHTMPQMHGDGVPNSQMTEGGILSPGPTSPLVRPQSPQDRTFSGFSTPPHEVL